jgi:hypothetical protein
MINRQPDEWELGQRARTRAILWSSEQNPQNLLSSVDKELTTLYCEDSTSAIPADDEQLQPARHDTASCSFIFITLKSVNATVAAGSG